MRGLLEHKKIAKARDEWPLKSCRKARTSSDTVSKKLER